MGTNAELLNQSLDALRDDIDQIDDAILDLIQKRENCVIEIAKIKQALSDSPQYYVPEREKAIIDRLTKKYHGRFSVLENPPQCRKMHGLCGV